MKKLNFWGYGGEYLVGSLNEKELDNIKILLRRFDSESILFGATICLDPDGYKSNFFEYNDSYCNYGVCSSVNVSLVDDDFDFDFDSFYNDNKAPAKLKEGFYLRIGSHEKGNFFSVEVPDDFNPDELKLEMISLDSIGFYDDIVGEVFYKGKQLEKIDDIDTIGKDLNIDIIYANKNGELVNGEDILLKEIDKFDNIITIDYDIVEEITCAYLEYANNDTITNNIQNIVALLPLLYERMPNDDFLNLFDPPLINALKDRGLFDDIPYDILKQISVNHPEYLI